MKESFKAGFGWMIGLYAGLVTIKVMVNLIDKKINVEVEKKETEEN